MSKTAAAAAISTKCGFTNGAAELLLLSVTVFAGRRGYNEAL